MPLGKVWDMPRLADMFERFGDGGRDCMKPCFTIAMDFNTVDGGMNGFEENTNTRMAGRNNRHFNHRI